MEDSESIFHAWALTHERIEHAGSHCDAQLGIRTEHTVSDAISGKPWLHIVDPETKTSWWVEDGTWIKPKAKDGVPGYHDAPSFRTAGELHLAVGPYMCVIHIAPAGFTEAEFQHLQDDFRAGLWTLLMAKQGQVRLRGKQESTANLSLFREFGRHASAVAKRPNVILRHSTQPCRIDRAPLNPTAIRDMIIHGQQRPRVLARVAHECVDTPENRFALSLIEKVVVNADLYGESLRSAARTAQSELDHMRLRSGQAAGTLKVSKRDIQRKVSLAFAQHERWQTLRDAVLPTLSLPQPVHGAVERDLHPRFKITAKKLRRRGNLVCVNTIKKTPVWVPEALMASHVLSPGRIYRISGTIQKYASENEAIYEFTRITAVEIEQSILNTYRNLQEQVNALGPESEWIELPVTASTSKQWALEVRAGKGREEALVRSLSDFSKIHSELGEIRQALADVSSLLRSRSVRPSEILPVSVVYSRTAAYRDLLASYKRILANSQLDDATLDRFLQMRPVSVLDMPRIYERWCLVQLINSLLQLKFQPEGEWKKELVSSLECIADPRPWSATFTNRDLSRGVVLHYQQPLNDKRPDFILDLFGVGASGEERSLRVVLDAKCKPFLRHPRADLDASTNTIEWELEGLISKYSEGTRNPTFVLHPSEMLSPYSVSECSPRDVSEFGGENVLKSFDHTNHRFGWVLLRPNMTEHIQLLVAMLLQYNIENNVRAYTERPVLPVFCIGCGNESLQTYDDGANNGPSQGERLACGKCGLRSIRHFCGSCGNRLWKHGYYWTYHQTVPGDPFNIVCPCCGEPYHEGA